MINNLKAELVRKGYDNPTEVIAACLSCAPKTAYNKLHGITQFSVKEAVKIKEKLFANDPFTIAYLFADDAEKAS
ncbi:MAG: hypothetical protein U0M23_04840 [Acutalibacteraceae bacterium]|nr:hypothetical protein [Acutalibacteraceae bacterium]HIR02534.1 hypothetical protein [Candidatus Scatovicinus merdipullorum]